MPKTQRACRHCGYEFEPRVPYPRRCPNRECQKMWPLGKPKKNQVRKVGPNWKGHAGKEGKPMFCPRCGTKCRKLGDDLAENAFFLCKSCAVEWDYVPDPFNTPRYIFGGEWSDDDFRSAGFSRSTVGQPREGNT